MRKLLPLLACLMLVLTGWSGMAHAAETANGSLDGIAFAVHAPGDGDEVPADEHRNAPHHHGICRGPDVGQPATCAVLALRRRAADRSANFAPPALVAAERSVTPRPPQA